MFNNIFDIPLNFLSEYLTGWTIIILIIIIIYFVALRNYYMTSEEFYDRNIEDIINSNKNNKPNKKNKINKKNKTNKTNTNIEGFESTIPQTTVSQATQYTQSTQSNQSILDTFINTTLFDNLKLEPEELLKCKTFYNTVIINFIMELTKLLKLMKNN